MNDSSLEQAHQVKLLGITVDHHLSWTPHIDYVISKMGRSIAVVRRCSSFVTPAVLKVVVQSLVLSHLEYCPIIWSATNKADLSRFQVVQNKAARLVLKCLYSTRVTEMHQTLSWPLLQKKFEYNLLIFLKKTIAIGKPHCCFDKIKCVNQTHSHCTRHAYSADLVLPRPKTNFLKKSVLYKATQLWNELPKELRDLPNVQTFKKALKSIT